MARHVNISVENLQKKARLNTVHIIKLSRLILKKVKINDADLSIVFVTRSKIQSLNKKYLKRSYATDVLAFDLKDNSLEGKAAKKNIHGEIFISIDAAMANAKIFKTTPSYELILYIVHGILHLWGYDDHRLSDIKRMRSQEEKILAHLGNKIKYSISR